MIEGNRPDPRWPIQGEVVFDRYKTRYRPGLDLVLKGISAHVKGGETVSTRAFLLQSGSGLVVIVTWSWDLCHTGLLGSVVSSVEFH